MDSQHTHIVGPILNYIGIIILLVTLYYLSDQLSTDNILLPKHILKD